MVASLYAFVVFLGLHVSVDVATLSFVSGTIIPVLVALVTRQTASPGLKASINFLLSIVAGFLSAFVAEAQGEIVSIDVASFVSAVAMAWITSVATHYGLLKPVGVTGTTGAIQTAIPGGIGKPQHVH